MKTSIYKIALFCLIFLLINDDGFAKAKQIEKRKEIKREFSTTASTQIKVDNRFGKVHVNTANTKTVSLEIEIIVSRKKEQDAQALLDKISIDIVENGDLLSFTTKLPSNVNSGRNENFEINYTLTVPMNNPLSVNNQFGPLYLANFDGPFDLKVGYGSIKVGNLSNDGNLKLDFGGGSLEGMAAGKLTVNYSNLEVGTLGDITVSSEFSDLSIDSGGKLQMTGKYGKLNMGTLDALHGKTSFASVSIEELRGSMDIASDYCSSFDIDKISKDFTDIKFSASFGNANLHFEKGSQADVNARFKFGNLRYDKSVFDWDKEIEDGNSKRYEGRLNNGGSNVDLSASYGNIELSVD